MGEKQVKHRESSFELLRILAMLGIITYHLVLHYTDFSRFSLINTEYAGSYYQLDFIQILFTLGQIGNTLFILITGYFLIDKNDIDVIRPSVKLLTKAYLTAIILLGVAYIFGRFHFQISANSNLHTSLNGWWFIGYYIFVIVFAKYFFNDFLKKLDQKKYLNFIIIFAVFLNFMEILSVFENLKIQNLATGCLVYAIGGYLKRYHPFAFVKTSSLIIGILIFVFIQIIQFKVNLNTNMRNFYMDPSVLFSDSPFTNILKSPSIIFLIVSILIFELFRRLEIGEIRIINYVSSATLTVYLFHESFFFRGLHFRSIPLPNRLGILNNPSTKIITDNLQKGSIVPLDNPDAWLPLKDFLNISQVIQERGMKIGIIYMLFLIVVIFGLGVLFEMGVRFVVKMFQYLFQKDLNILKKVQYPTKFN